MVPINKCPSCKESVGKAVLHDMKIGSMSRTLQGVSFCCPICGAILGVSPDPAALVADVVKAMKKGG
ncbi:MAG TPA: hypothetical protein VGT78_09820 [Rhizomicrobium sp.]|nr:hypothetical protein [Rhizomicrobium sp.]